MPVHTTNMIFGPTKPKIPCMFHLVYVLTIIYVLYDICKYLSYWLHVPNHKYGYVCMYVVYSPRHGTMIPSTSMSVL